MAKLSILAGATSQSVNLFIQNSSSTTGAGLTALSSNTSGLVAYYTFQGASATATAITISALSAATTAYASGGFVQISSANMPGLYRFDLPNAAIASASGRAVTLMLNGAANMAPCIAEIELTGWDNQSATNGGLSALPTANPGAVSGLLIAGTNAAVTVSSLTCTGNFSINGVSDVAQTGDNFARIGATGSGLTSLAQASVWTSALAASINTLASHDPGTTIGTSTLTQTQVTGGAYNIQSSSCILGDARIADLDASVSSRMATYTQPTGFLSATFPSGTVANTTNITSGTITTVTNLTNAPTAGDFTSAMKTSLNNSTPASITGSVGSVVAACAITSNRKKGGAATFEFTMQDSTTGADKTGLTVSSVISKDGGSFASTSNAVTEVANGWYQMALTATEMTANNVALQMTAAGATARDLSIQTQP